MTAWFLSVSVAFAAGFVAASLMSSRRQTSSFLEGFNYGVLHERWNPGQWRVADTRDEDDLHEWGIG